VGAGLGAPLSSDDGVANGSSAWNTSMNSGPSGPRVVAMSDMTAQTWSARDNRSEDGLTLVALARAPVRGVGRLSTASPR
jgi:hypothetical protein